MTDRLSLAAASSIKQTIEEVQTIKGTGHTSRCVKHHTHQSRMCSRSCREGCSGPAQGTRACSLVAALFGKKGGVEGAYWGAGFGNNDTGKRAEECHSCQWQPAWCSHAALHRAQKAARLPHEAVTALYQRIVPSPPVTSQL